MSTIHGGFDCLPRGEAERLRRDLDDARAALATVTLDRDVWRAQCEAAMRERDEARAEVATACAAMGHGSDDARWKPGETAVDALIRERDEARADADYHRSRAESWQATAETYLDQRDEARREMDEFALSVGYGERPEGWESGVRRLSGEDMAGHWKRIVRERDEAREAYDALVDTIRERIPYAYDDGTDDEATPDECVEYAADEIASLKRQRGAP